MPSKVFISCGQNTPEERRVAQDVSAWFSSIGYVPYVAIEVQTILDLNAGIINELKSSDYYLFINFSREEVLRSVGNIRRGSVYTNQELAIAYAYGFDHMLLINQQGATPEGVHHFIVSNVPEFRTHAEVLPLVQNAVTAANWSPSFSRHLMLSACFFSPSPFTYGDHTGRRNVHAVHGRISNNRADRGAIGCVARLAYITDPSAYRAPCFDRSHLKARFHQGYEQTILPSSYGEFDLFAIDMAAQSRIYLMSELDINPRQPIITQPGLYILEYEVYSIEFPVLRFSISLTVTGNHSTTTFTFQII